MCVEAFVWDLRLGAFVYANSFGAAARELSLGNFSLGTFAWGLSLGASRVGSEAVGILFLRRGDRLGGAGGIGLAVVVSPTLRN